MRTRSKSHVCGLRYARDVTDTQSGSEERNALVSRDNGARSRVPAGRTAQFGSKFAGWLDATNHNAEIIDAIRRARVSLPGDPGFGDPLSTAGPGKARAFARAADRLVGDKPGATRELRLGALQVWQAVLERAGKGKGDRRITIVFTDLVGFSSWALEAGDETSLELLRDVAKAIEPPVIERGGHVVKRLGDGLMAVFTSADRALQAVVDMQEHLDTVQVAGYKPQMRIGLHTGSPREIGDDWLGVDVNIAARVMEAGGNGNTMLSATTLESLHEDILDDLGLAVKPYRRSFFAAPLTGVPEDLRIFSLKQL